MNEDPLAFYPISSRVKQPREIIKALCFGGMIVRECLDLRSQHDKPRFMSKEVSHRFGTGTPDTFRVSVNRCRGVGEVLDVRIF